MLASVWIRRGGLPGAFGGVSCVGRVISPSSSSESPKASFAQWPSSESESDVESVKVSLEQQMLRWRVCSERAETLCR